MFEAKIPYAEQTNVMGSFWTMMMELETVADNENDILLKRTVKGCMQQWNRIMKDTKLPKWEMRAVK